MTHQKKQHFVPQLLLKNFSHPQSALIQVFDKHNDRMFSTTVGNIASQNYFYDGVGPDGDYSLEPFLSHYESLAAPVIRKIVEGASLFHLQEAEYLCLLGFVALQIVRVKHLREFLDEAITHSRGRLQQFGSEFQVEHLFPQSPEQQRSIELRSLQRSFPQVMHAIVKHSACLLRSLGGSGFSISDNPVVRGNQVVDEVTGIRLTGVASLGIELVLPLAPHTAIYLMCTKTVSNAWQVLHNDIASARPGRARRLSESQPAKCLNALRTGGSVILARQHVERMNEAQVHGASQYVYGVSLNAERIRSTLAQHPESVRPQRAEFGVPFGRDVNSNW